MSGPRRRPRRDRGRERGRPRRGRPGGAPRATAHGRAAQGGEAPPRTEQVQLKQRRGSPHPWVWRTMLDRRSAPDVEPGAVVRVLDRDGEVVGQALYHPSATIALRVLTSDAEEAIDADFFARRLGAALALRRDVLAIEEACATDAFRLAHAEADGLPGLVVDVLGGVVLAEVFARGMARQAEAIRAALGRLLPEHRVVLRADRRAGEIEGFDLPPRDDDPAATEVQEGGVRYKVDLRAGHKTGFFCDQRENRALLARLARGRTVLDCHTYTGGFALAAAVRGDATVTGVDLDEQAIATAKRNAKLNQTRAAKFVQADAFHYLRQQRDAGKAPPDVLVLDPPKLARDRSEKGSALRAYGDLNRLGLETVADGGLLLTCSCSGVVSEEDLLDVLRSAAARTRREVTVLRLAGAGPDHPVALHAPEGRYLKAVFARVRRL